MPHPGGRSLDFSARLTFDGICCGDFLLFVCCLLVGGCEGRGCLCAEGFSVLNVYIII